MMPGEFDGLDVCRAVRAKSDVPIIILSARSGESQKVAALDMGADDYLTKPFGMEELLARVRAALRRAPRNPQATEEVSFVIGDLVVDYARRIVSKGGQEVKLTKLEYDILHHFTRNPDRVITHRQLLSAVWGAEYSEDTQLLRVHVGHLRRKIEDEPARPKLIVTEPAVGYRFRIS
jgi:two-component system KDP operon response regulator KdpE